MKPSIRRVLILGLLASASLIWALPQYDVSDLLPFTASGRAVLDGRNPYETPEVEPGITPTLTPPYTLPLLSLIGRAEYEVLYPAWWAGSLGLYLLNLALLLRAYPERRTPVFVAWTLAYMPLWSTLRWAQVYMPLLVCVTVAWLALQRQRWILAGLALGLLIATKPNFAIWPMLLLLSALTIERLWPLSIHLSERAKPALMAFGVACLLTVAPIFWYGPGILLDWLKAGAIEAMSRTANYAEMSLRGFGMRLGLPWLGIALAVAMVLWLAWWAWRKCPDALMLSRQALIGSMLAAPIMWPGYAVLLLPVWFHARWTWPLVVAGALFVIPHELPLLVTAHPLVAQMLPLRVALWSLFMAALAVLLTAPLIERAHLHLTRVSAPGRTAALTAGKR